MSMIEYRRAILTGLTIAFLLSCGCLTAVCAQDVGFRSQTSIWTTIDKNSLQPGFRFLPELSYTRRLSNTYEFSAEAAANVTWFSRYKNFARTGNSSDIDPYRLWVRLSAAQYELRAGLQKINFGSATLLRPLRWFDSVDPRDPLKLSDGVYGLLGRYYFLNNTNVWVWGLYDNDDLKGWEALPGDRHKVEVGGRVQFPVKSGEMAVSLHRRHVNIYGNQVSAVYPVQGDFAELSLGLDGKWDVGAGLWFEGTVTRQDFRSPDARYKSFLTVGTDYTFDVGNGLHLLFEEFMSVEASHPFSSGRTLFMSGLSGDYPLNLLDTLSAVVYYDQKQDDWSRFVTWRRTYDNWQVHISAFWNPDQSYEKNDAAVYRLAGHGVQVMLVFNN